MGGDEEGRGGEHLGGELGVSPGEEQCEEVEGEEEQRGGRRGRGLEEVVEVDSKEGSPASKEEDGREEKEEGARGGGRRGGGKRGGERMGGGRRGGGIEALLPPDWAGEWRAGWAEAH